MMVSLATKEEIEEITERWKNVSAYRKLFGAKLNNETRWTDEAITDIQCLVFTVRQSRDALRVALNYIEGKDKPSKVLALAIIKETLGEE